MTNDEYRELVEFLGRQFTALDGRFVAIDRRFAALEERVEQGFREVNGHFDAIYVRFDRLEQESAVWPRSGTGSPSSRRGSTT